jgi:hypothetical protein
MVVRFSAVMGAEREDSDSRVKRPSTEPGLGAPPSARSGETPAAAPADADAGAVDFDALHAALGDPLALDDLPPVSSSRGALNAERAPHEAPAAAPAAPPPPRVKSSPALAESSGRSSATYASARPRTIPPTRAPVEDPNVPPVIVASEDTVPSAPPGGMTVPMARAQVPAGRGSDPHLGAPGSGPHLGAPGSGPHLGAPGPSSSGQHANAAPAYGFAPPAFGDGAPLPRQPRNAAQMTMRMPDRPINPVSPINPRRHGQATVVVRPRGPSARQKLLVFMAMLLLVTACGIAVTIWRNPSLFGIEPAGGGAGTPSAVPGAAAVAPPSTFVTQPPASAAPALAPATSALPGAATGAAPGPVAPPAALAPPAAPVRPRPAKVAAPSAATTPLR